MSRPHTSTLPASVKAGYALGDHAVNVQLAAVSLLYLYFLTEIAGLRPSLAGLVVLSGRAVDAFTDPAMGRISDRTSWRWGRRRPYFLIGALPFGLTSALLWAQLPVQHETALFLSYVALYIANALCSTVLAVPYMALLPELALSYQERISANTYRSIAVVVGVLLTAVSVRPLVEWMGGGAQGWQRMGVVLGAWVALPWFVVYRVSFERPGFQGHSDGSFVQGLTHLAAHRSYRRLCGLFLAGRIAVDVSGAMLIFYFSYWLGRPDEFGVALGLMLGMVALSLPVWLRFSQSHDKCTLFMIGALWWIAIMLVLFFARPEDPAWGVLALICLAGIGYGVTDMIPWSMLGDVIDEDELRSGERREGIYAGSFTFLRKLGGATGVAVAGAVLDLAGFVKGQAQPDTASLAVRVLTFLVPAFFLGLALFLARSYPLSRRRHAAVVEALDARAGERAGGGLRPRLRPESS